jgi:hypothetical protein
MIMISHSVVDDGGPARRACSSRHARSAISSWLARYGGEGISRGCHEPVCGDTGQPDCLPVPAEAERNDGRTIGTSTSSGTSCLSAIASGRGFGDGYMLRGRG